MAVTVAVAEIGKGEEGGNNLGPHIRKYGAPPGGSWCAAFTGWVYREAAVLAKLKLPFERSLSAKGLGRNMAKVGRKFYDQDEAKFGDLVIWHRGLVPWQGHVGIVTRNEGGTVAVIEGNTGSYPSKVKQLVHDTSTERLAFFASLRRTDNVH